MSEEIKEIIFQLEIVARKHTIKVLDDGNIETMPASVVDELRLNNYSAKILLNYITNLQKENDWYKKEHEKLNNALNGKITNFKFKKWEELKKYIGEEWYCFDNESLEFEIAKSILNKMKELEEG